MGFRHRCWWAPGLRLPALSCAQVQKGMCRLLWKHRLRLWPEAGGFQAASQRGCWEAVAPGASPHPRGRGSHHSASSVSSEQRGSPVSKRLIWWGGPDVTGTLRLCYWGEGVRGQAPTLGAVQAWVRGSPVPWAKRQCDKREEPREAPRLPAL